MPQLMPFFWINSLFMVVLIMVVLVFFYFLKNKENVNVVFFEDKMLVKFNLLW